MALSDSWLKANHRKERAEREEKSDRDGLSVRVTPKGKIIFQMRYRYDKKLQRLDLGSYPLMSLKGARDENQRLKKELERGHDPKIVRRLEKQAIMDAASLQSLFACYLLFLKALGGVPVIRLNALLKAAASL